MSNPKVYAFQKRMAELNADNDRRMRWIIYGAPLVALVVSAILIVGTVLLVKWVWAW